MIKLYYMKTEEFRKEETFRMGCGMIDEFRLQKVNKCKGTEDKVRSLCCGLLLQYAVRQEIGKLPGRSLRYHTGAYGKPYFLDHPQLHFNLSHSGSYAALALSAQEIGIDIQKKRPVKENLAKRILSDWEYEQYRKRESCHKGSGEEYFFRCWCARESYGKLCGVGLGRVLEGICYETESGRIWESGEGKDENAAMSREYRIGAEYIMNVCIYEKEMEKGGRFPKEGTCVSISHILS